LRWRTSHFASKSSHLDGARIAEMQRWRHLVFITAREGKLSAVSPTRIVFVFRWGYCRAGDV